jgi:hypothetical protein
MTSERRPFVSAPSPGRGVKPREKFALPFRASDECTPGAAFLFRDTPPRRDTALTHNRSAISTSPICTTRDFSFQLPPGAGRLLNSHACGLQRRQLVRARRCRRRRCRRRSRDAAAEASSSARQSHTVRPAATTTATAGSRVNGDIAMQFAIALDTNGRPRVDVGRALVRRKVELQQTTVAARACGIRAARADINTAAGCRESDCRAALREPAAPQEDAAATRTLQPHRVRATDWALRDDGEAATSGVRAAHDDALTAAETTAGRGRVFDVAGNAVRAGWAHRVGAIRTGSSSAVVARLRSARASNHDDAKPA